MKLFVRDEDDSLSYTATIKNMLRFELTVDYVSIGMSFRQTAAAIQFTKDRTKTAKLTGINDMIVGQYTRVLVGARPCPTTNRSSPPAPKRSRAAR